MRAAPAAWEDAGEKAPIQGALDGSAHYNRNGTTTLFAALNILDGTVVGRCMPSHTHKEFIKFLNAVALISPPDAGRTERVRRLSEAQPWRVGKAGRRVGYSLKCRAARAPPLRPAGALATFDDIAAGCLVAYIYISMSYWVRRSHR